MPFSLLRWRYGLALVLGLIGLGLNALPIYLLTRDTPAFAFGGAAVLLSFVCLGTGPGLLSALVSLVPFLATGDALGLAALIAVLEAWVATLLYRQFGSLVFTVGAFWFTVGWLIDLAVYGGIAGLPRDLLVLVFIKQVFSGILNALVAEGVLRIPAIASRLPARDSILSATLKQYVFSRVLFVVMIPALALAILYTRAAYQGEIQETHSRVERSAQEIQGAMQEALGDRETALRDLSRGIQIARALNAPAGGLLGSFLKDHPSFLAIALADEQGVVAPGLASGRGDLIPGNVAATGCFSTAQAQQRTAYEAPRSQPSPLNAYPALFLCEPVLGGEGQSRGVLVGRLDPVAIASVLSREARRGPEVATLLDHEQRVLASLDPRVAVGTSVAGLLPAEAVSGQDPRSFTYTPCWETWPEAARALRRHYSAYRRLTASGFGVLVDLPASSLYAALMPSAYRILLLLLANLLALYAVVTRFARDVSEPLLAVNEAANDIAGGHFPSVSSLQLLARNPIGEIQSVALHFMSMRDALAYRDALTGLPNRRLFLDRLGLALAQARRSREGLAVLYVDLDRFRLVDDSLGHAVGNLLLRSLSERLETCVGDGDTVARLGGDEFAVLARLVEREEDAARVARLLLEAMRSPFTVADRELFVTGSIGVSLFPNDGNAAEALLNNAHTAMHQAKAEGRDTYRLYTSAMNDHALEQLALEGALRKALPHDQLVVYYQPLVSLKSGRAVGAEALVRWHHPERGLVAASEFIALAESSGLIEDIDSWVLRRACTQAREWHRRGRNNFKVEVNLSARQFQHPDLVGEVTRCLRETGIPAGTLEIEITERIAMLDLDRSVDVLRALRALGVHISLDDFGTGYSSLSYLNALPVDTVKLDQSFVRHVTTDPGDAAIATAVIAMAHSLDLRVVAEGVETAEQLAFLRARGCDVAQGHLVGVPMPADRLDLFLEQNVVERLPLVAPVR